MKSRTIAWGVLATCGLFGGLCGPAHSELIAVGIVKKSVQRMTVPLFGEIICWTHTITIDCDEEEKPSAMVQFKYTLKLHRGAGHPKGGPISTTVGPTMCGAYDVTLCFPVGNDPQLAPGKGVFVDASFTGEFQESDTTPQGSTVKVRGGIPSQFTFLP